MRIILTGGGTGGHLFPLIAVAKKLKEKLGPEAEFLYIGSGAPMEREAMEKEGIPVKNVKSGKLRRYFSLKNVTDAFRIPVGIVQSLWILLRFMPDAVFSKGGFASVPIVIAAWIYRIPVLIHESDAIAGLANEISAKFAKRIAVSYPSAKKYFPEKKTAVIGTPVREDIIGGDPAAGRAQFFLTQSKPTVLVLGGSQGSQIINGAIVRVLPRLLQRAQVIHQTGADNYERVVHEAAEYGIKAGREGYVAIPFLDTETLRNAFAVCDLVVSRAGANFISEIAANGKPAILIPLGTAANDHQRMNAHDISQVGGALVLEESNLGEHILLQKIEKILDDKELANSMAEKMKTFYHPNADEVIANGVIEMI
ncbi:MAG TPA: undecaprenyldiphospho-muramoylpentapeptide beta-N-acetylglucosaminyltransferase [Candidatus Moranbacteria bacterium]|nr:MAG: UDP-N-acetylglucosamine-N-acetylmuramyl-(pentapeptide) pyrophosphoryl-undecaprenol N-acetylglucosamine transferase [Candidatus Moranbacteria bacterium GW2011_GWC2_45_10]KKT95022.1 MAG: hypothetical protein UW95_C0005G0009 [Parcubacteria group bacterium GW2011_GWC1_45_14]HAV11527.1 undecaprenyldiphospho-muramoylpentapeptide beta-N-acetylglucosaminyltransferase [Candidatus Moranbacteria bacterium]